MHLGKVGFFRRPVIHFRVDIDGVFAVPGRFVGIIPYCLLPFSEKIQIATIIIHNIDDLYAKTVLTNKEKQYFDNFLLSCKEINKHHKHATRPSRYARVLTSAELCSAN